MKYFVEFTDGTRPFFTQDAIDFKEMIVKLAIYTGDNSILFQNALSGLTDEAEMVDLYNVFSSLYQIDRILKVESIVYER